MEPEKFDDDGFYRELREVFGEEIPIFVIPNEHAVIKLPAVSFEDSMQKRADAYAGSQPWAVADCAAIAFRHGARAGAAWVLNELQQNPNITPEQLLLILARSRKQ